jgi:excisionase family DNA binding protein
MPAAPERRWARPKKTAEHLDVGVRTVWTWIADGRLTAYRLGGVVLLDLAEVDAAVEPTRGGSS